MLPGAPISVDVHHTGRIAVYNEKEDFQKQHCNHCTNGVITERTFNDKKALEYLQSIGKQCPVGISQQAHAYSAQYWMAINGLNPETLYYANIYECPYRKQCEFGGCK